MNAAADHLVLLVGDNPLPLALAVVAFQDLSLVSLIHTDETNRVALRLQAWIERSRGLSARRYQLEQPASPSEAYRVCLRAIREAPGSCGSLQSLCMDYTGGTKVMAAQARRAALRAEAEGLARQVTFSYLDFDAAEWVLDREPLTGGWEEPQERRLRASFCLTLDDIVAVHGRQITQRHSRPVLPESASTLARTLTDEQGYTRWQQWKSVHLQRLLGLPVDVLGDQRLELPAGHPLGKSMARELGLGSLEGLPLFHVARCAGLTPVEFCNWLNGQWLESYVFRVVLELAADLRITDSCCNLSSVPDVAGGDVSDKFEVDVAGVVGGSRLVVLSCTTDSSKKKAKHKLFELSNRTRQLGGARSAFGLVSCCPDGRLLDELRGLAEQRSGSVFDVRHPDFEGQLRAWLSDIAHVRRLRTDGC